MVAGGGGQKISWQRLPRRTMLGRSILANVAGQASVLVLGFASAIALARWLGPSDRGLLALIAYTNELTVAVAAVGCTYAVAYFVSRPDADRGAVLGNSLLLGSLLGAAFIPLFAIFGATIARLLSRGHGAHAWRLVGLLIVFTFLDWSLHNQLFGKLQFGLLNALIALSRVASLLAVVVFIGAAGWGVVGGILATMAAALVLILGSLWSIRDLTPHIDFRLFRKMISYGARVSPGWLFQIVNYRVDVFILQAFVPLARVGEYVIAVLVAELALTIGSAVQTSVMTLVARYEGQQLQGETITRSVRHAVLLTTVSVAVLVLAGSRLITVAFGSDFATAIRPMHILLPGMLFLGVGAVVTGNLRGLGQPGMSSVLAGLTVVVTLPLDLALIPRYGVAGAAVASSIAYAVYGSTSLVVLSRITRTPLGVLSIPQRADIAVYGRVARALAAAAGSAANKLVSRVAR